MNHAPELVGLALVVALLCAATGAELLALLLCCGLVVSVVVWVAIGMVKR